MIDYKRLLLSPVKYDKSNFILVHHTEKKRKLKQSMKEEIRVDNLSSWSLQLAVNQEVFQTNMKYACIICVILSSFLALVDCRAAPRDCHDKFHNCETWKRSGFCGANTHAFYLRNGCAKTCGFCKSNIPLTHNLHAVQDAPLSVHKIGPKEHLGAVTASHKQNTAASVGSLHHQKLHAPPQVPQHQRTSGESGEKPECMDRFVTQTCKNWKDGDICMDDRYRKYLTYGCALTCRFCNCRDTYRENPYCAEWKSRGFCETYKDQLESYCPKTCGFCISK
ncbi:hypothetical protein OS493_005930 [Desmophyllum pertusum]|uniref:ShKT domain-containing protein n=1 Tax=Desmophyllum pertusum TaxID=174260 RepID=A0A9X0CGN8_9CNID|nr:hypothetical protein OS493_005930 [Desmophyllum pertusum]